MICLQAPIAWISFGALAASPEVTGAARLYFDIRIWSAPFVFCNYAVVGAIVGRGRTDIALVLQLLINLVNIALNIALVYGLVAGRSGLGGWHARGRGSGRARWFFYYVAHVRAIFSGWPARTYFSIARKIARMFAINRDIFIRNTALLFAFAFFTAQGARGGDIKLAANAILMNLILVAAYFLDGFATPPSKCAANRSARGTQRVFALPCV